MNLKSRIWLFGSKKVYFKRDFKLISESYVLRCVIQFGYLLNNTIDIRYLNRNPAPLLPPRRPLCPAYAFDACTQHHLPPCRVP